MADPELVAYIAKHARLHGESVVRTQLVRDGIPPSEIDEAFAEAQMSTMRKAKQKRKLALLAVGLGGLLILMAVLLSNDAKKPPPPETAELPDAAASAEPTVFQGHYGYMLRLPAGYEANAEFVDAEKRIERVYIYPSGTDHSHFIHEGLYGHLGILKLEAAPRRVPQGFIGVDTLKSFVKRKLDGEKAVYKMRDLMVHGMGGFIVSAEKPFTYVRAHMVGEKTRFMLVGGVEDALFTDILSSLAEVSPRDEPGR